jgi:hypothetical protein
LASRRYAVKNPALKMSALALAPAGGKCHGRRRFLHKPE